MFNAYLMKSISNLIANFAKKLNGVMQKIKIESMMDKRFLHNSRFHNFKTSERYFVNIFYNNK